MPTSIPVHSEVYGRPNPPSPRRRFLSHTLSTVFADQLLCFYFVFTVFTTVGFSESKLEVLNSIFNLRACLTVYLNRARTYISLRFLSYRTASRVPFKACSAFLHKDQKSEHSQTFHFPNVPRLSFKFLSLRPCLIPPPCQIHPIPNSSHGSPPSLTDFSLLAGDIYAINLPEQVPPRLCPMLLLSSPRDPRRHPPKI
jgi:hypothetical protein